MLNRSREFDYDYFVLISGECLPLKHKLKLNDFLTLNNKSFIEINRLPEYDWRINTYNFFRDQCFVRWSLFKIINFPISRVQRFLPRRGNFTSSEIRMGSSWFVLKRKHVDFIISKSTDSYQKKFKYTTCSDEHYFQMLLKEQDDVITRNLHYIRFSNGNSSPDYLSEDDIYNVTTDVNCYFVRKVSENIMNIFKN